MLGLEFSVDNILTEVDKQGLYCSGDVGDGLGPEEGFKEERILVGSLGVGMEGEVSSVGE
jgi:hypothetical protein